MKKIALISLVLILLSVTAIPVMADPGSSNGHGNGASSGGGNSNGNQDWARERDKDKNRDVTRNQDKQRDRAGIGANGRTEHSRVRMPFYLQGIIVSRDTNTYALVVTPYHGNARIKEFLGTNLTLQASAGTLIYKIDQGGDDSDGSNPESTEEDGTPAKVQIPFDQLEALQRVAIHGDLVDGVYVVRLITVYIREPVE